MVKHMILSEQQVKQYLYNAGFRGSHLNAGVQIAFCESSFNPYAHNTSGEDSRGLMQINVYPNANPQYANLNLFDPGINTKVAFEIYKNAGYTFKDWSCAKSLKLVNPIRYENFIIPGLLVASFGLIIYFNQ